MMTTDDIERAASMIKKKKLYTRYMKDIELAENINFSRYADYGDKILISVDKENDEAGFNLLKASMIKHCENKISCICHELKLLGVEVDE